MEWFCFCLCWWHILWWEKPPMNISALECLYFSLPIIFWMLHGGNICCVEVHATPYFRNSDRLGTGGYYAGFANQRHDSIPVMYFRFLHLGGAATARTVHLLASYWGLVLMSFHAGMHGNRIMEVFRKITTTQQTSKIRTWSLRMIIVLLAICGLYTFIKTKSDYIYFEDTICIRWFFAIR